ncbi:MAG: hypothetical protein A2X64_06045 [Ignavibacteria bacterium GWF2_33_9]|nr:MAG: hypothetical protein A2X64_06045 [Ignavibacteria bacterium GWF2_33_9]
MKKLILLALIILLGINTNTFAKDKKTQPPSKKKFKMEDARDFKFIKTAELSYWGKWASYEVYPDWGDGYLKVVQTTDTSKKYTIERGTKGEFTNDENWLACLIQPKAIEVENAKTPKDKPKNTLKIIELNTHSEKEIEKVKKFIFSEDNKWLVYEKDESIEKDKKLKFKPLGSNISIVHLKSKTEIKMDNVYDYVFDSLSHYLFYSVSSPDGKTDGLFYRNLTEEFAPEYSIEKKDKTLYSNLTFSDSSRILAYLTSEISDDGQSGDCELKIWNEQNPNLVEIGITKEQTPKDWFIYYKNSLKFTKDGKRLWIGLKPVSEKYEPEKPEKKYTDSNFTNLDTIQSNSNLILWNYKDPKIMTYQETNWNREKDKTYPSLFDLKTRKLTQIADLQLTDVVKADNPDFTIGYDENPYLLSSMWDYFRFDMYKINLQTGEKTLIVTELEETGNLSFDGNYTIYYKDSTWYDYDNTSGARRIVNEGMQNPFYDEDHDTPNKAGSYGFAGWVEGSKRFMINDKYDIWIFNSEEPRNRASLTVAYGRSNKITYRLQTLDRKKEYYTKLDTALITGFHTELKWNNLYRQDFKILGPEKLTFHEDKVQKCLTKAKGNNRALVTIENFQTFPDLYIDENLYRWNDTNRRISDVNPQMKDYTWGTTQLIDWVDSQGNKLQGFIMKPENFDPNKRYPVIIHFYEKFSDYMCTFQRPQLNHRPNPVIYTNDDYVVFYPDIVFTIGYPGYSAVDALETGAKKLIDMGIADPNAIGLQGHSWSGYQTAFIITQTDFFKAACAGAPVSNMTSAYSGIRLGSGMARQFQYEKQQSRIGGNLWDSLDNYLKNSPIFEAKGGKTPLLIKFGDKDDAVPWEQGIELFLALKRLGKVVYMLEYENEPHIVRQYRNKVDYAIKMKEYFDHFLKGKPAPDWMENPKPYKGN